MRKIAIGLCCLVLLSSNIAAAGKATRRYAGRIDGGGAVRLSATKRDMKHVTIKLPHNCKGKSPLKVKLKKVAYDGREFADMRQVNDALLLIEGQVSKKKASGILEYIDFSGNRVCEISTTWKASRKK